MSSNRTKAIEWNDTTGDLLEAGILCEGTVGCFLYSIHLDDIDNYMSLDLEMKINGLEDEIFYAEICALKGIEVCGIDINKIVDNLKAYAQDHAAGIVSSMTETAH